MDNSKSDTSGRKYENQIKFRKAKLEQMRKERELLQNEKLKREKATQKNLTEIRLKKEIREQAERMTDSNIDEIQQEINAFNQDGKIEQTLVLNAQLNEGEIRSHNSMLNLKCSTLEILEIQPNETTTHSIHTQTDISRLHIQNIEPKKYEYEDRDYQDDELKPLTLFCNFSSNLPPGILSPGLPTVMDMPPALTPIDKENPWSYLKERKKKILEDQCEEMILSKNFQKSLKNVGLSMEKVLSNNKNICVDYIGDVEGCINDINPKALLNLNHVFLNENVTKGRCVTCIDWSPHSSDRIVASYYKNKESNIDTGEDVIIWNQNMKNQTPEHVFHSQSSVMSLRFTKFSANLVLGATYSGQIVLWDNRVKTSIPVQCTKLNCKAHTQPIYCLREIGCENSRNIISISSDGKLCSWNLDMLTRPTDIMQLQLDVSDKIKKPISVTCMDFSANGKNNLVLGGEDGYAYSAFRYGYESGINNRYENHEAPISGISSHYNQISTDFGNLFLTTSIDCTIKLWSLENSNPLHTFKNNYDYVMDVAWSPVHPAVFIAVDGSGYLDLYNLNEIFEEPIKSINIKGGTAINRVAWNNDGQYVAAGTENGELNLYKIAEDLVSPGSEEWKSFKKILQNISVNYETEFYA